MQYTHTHTRTHKHTHLFVKVVEMLLSNLVITSRRHGSRSLLARHGRGRLVHVGEEHRLGEEGLVVLPGAAVSVTACADFEIEGTVYPATSLALVRAEQLVRPTG
jgi:hypothetical protein